MSQSREMYSNHKNMKGDVEKQEDKKEIIMNVKKDIWLGYIVVICFSIVFIYVFFDSYNKLDDKMFSAVAEIEKAQYVGSNNSIRSRASSSTNKYLYDVEFIWQGKIYNCYVLNKQIGPFEFKEGSSIRVIFPIDVSDGDYISFRSERLLAIMCGIYTFTLIIYGIEMLTNGYRNMERIKNDKELVKIPARWNKYWFLSLILSISLYGIILLGIWDRLDMFLFLR